MRYLLALMLISTIIATTSISYAQEYIATPIADTYVRQGFPDTNYGISAALLYRNAESDGQTNLVLMDFFPANPEQIITATLYFYSYNNSGTVTNFYETHSGWDETTTTWNNRPALGGYIDTITTTEGWNSTDISGAIRNRRGVALQADEPGLILRFVRSRQSSLSPYIVYQYAPTPTPSATATPSPTATPSAAQTIIELPSGGRAVVSYSLSAGEVMTVGGLLAVLLTMLFLVIRSYADKAGVQ
jgi:hypothetical protein